MVGDRDHERPAAHHETKLKGYLKDTWCDKFILYELEDYVSPVLRRLSDSDDEP